MDADILAYRTASANEKRYDWGEGVTSHIVNDDFEAIKKDIQSELDDLLLRTEADDFLICLSDDNYNWRKKVLPSYKQHRKNSIRPELLYPLKDYLFENYPSYRKETLEADDVMGILSTHPKLIAGKKIIVSEDKDMKTIPGWLFNPKKDKKPRLITPEAADRFHMYQTITGDTTDGYKGCPDVGDKGAIEMLDSPFLMVPYEYEFQRGKRKGTTEVRYEQAPAPSLWEGIVSLYEWKGLTEYDAITQARVARILRHTDYDFKTKEVIYWNPVKPQTTK
ncbi:hypothetical protein [Methylovorus sp. MM2]|uniref:hypothetical protein n=1 Tax=Methylovorus sp. MM2 TaxID=1848038 RepID=UPI00210FB651|nr:hypothetical protein [Methylovorus sp. MM2]